MYNVQRISLFQNARHFYKVDRRGISTLQKKWRLKILHLAAQKSLNLYTLSGPKQLLYFLALETVFSWPFAYSIKAIVNRTNLVNRHLNWS